MKNIITTCLVSVLHLTLANYSYSEQPPYQVSIMLEMPGNSGDPIHLCNGAIIYEKLILTTADCVHFKFGLNGRPNKLDASVISVLAGSTNAQTDALQINVSSVEIAKNFDPITLENDLALLTLSQSLPLGKRSDIRWIMLDDNSHVNKSCLVNFFSRNTKDAIPDYYQTEELYMINNDICRNSTKYPTSRKRDICSLYVLPHQYDCAKADSFLSFNNDRGTGFVCKSFLVGLLSSVVTRPNPANNCTDVTLRAIYTNIYPHLRWIYSIMSTIETEYISTPYDASLNPLVVNSNPAANITSPFNSTLITNSTTLPNSTHSVIPFTNITTSNSTNYFNSTLTNLTIVNVTILNYATPSPIPLNLTIWNTTVINVTNSSRNHTTHTVRPSTVPASIAGYGHSPDSQTKPAKPAIQNFFKNNGALVRFSAGSLLIPLVFLRLIAFYL